MKRYTKKAIGFLILLGLIIAGKAQNLNGKAQIIEIKTSNYTFPLVKTSSKEITDKINTYLINSEFGNDNAYNITINNIQVVLQKRQTDFDNRKDDLSEVGYNLLCNDQNVLSLSTYQTSRGHSFPFSNSDYNFDLKTGSIFGIAQTILPSAINKIIGLIKPELIKELTQCKQRIQADNKWDDSKQQYWNDAYTKSTQGDFSIRGIRVLPNGISFTITQLHLGLPFRQGLEYDPKDDYLLTWYVIRPYLLPNCPVSALANLKI